MQKSCDQLQNALVPPNSYHQGCGVGGKVSESDLSKISDFDSLTSWKRNLTVKISGNRGAQQVISVSTKVSKELYHFNRILNLGVWCKKRSNWTSAVGVWQKNPTPSPYDTDSGSATVATNNQTHPCFKVSQKWCDQLQNCPRIDKYTLRMLNVEFVLLV